MDTDNHRRLIRVWLRYLAQQSPMGTPDAATVIAFRDWAARTRRASTVNVLLDVLRLFYRWVEASGQGIDIAADVGELPVYASGQSAIDRLTDAQVTSLLHALPLDDAIACRTAAIIAILQSCAVDAASLSRANRSAVDLGNGTIRLTRRWRISNHLRGASARDVAETFPLSPTAQTHLRAYLAIRSASPRSPASPGSHPSHEPLFTIARDGGRLSALSIRLSVMRALVAAGLRSEATGVSRNAIKRRFPTIAAADVAGLSARLPTDPEHADRLRALVHLLVSADARVGWTRLRISQVDTAHRLLRLERLTQWGRSVRHHPLSDEQAAGIAPWLARRRTQGASDQDLVFCGTDGRGKIPRPTLLHWAWSLFPERLPPPDDLGSAYAGTRLLRRSSSPSSTPVPPGPCAANRDTPRLVQ